MTNEQLYASPAYRRSRKAYAFECTFEYFFAILLSDSFLAKLLAELGFTDAQIGVIASLISLAFLFQLLAVPVVRRISNVKRFSILFHMLGEILFMSLYMIPFLPLSPAGRRIMAVVGLLVAYMCNYLVSSSIFRWGNGFVMPSKRGIFSANKEMLSLLCGMAVSLGVGYVMDYFEYSGQLRNGFVFAACAMCAFSLCDLICLLLIQNKSERLAPEHQESTLAVVRKLVRNRSFCAIVLLNILWDTARYMSMGFMGTFKLNDLLLTMGQVQLINIVSSAARILASRPFGRYADRHSFVGGIELALLIAMGAFAMTVFTTPATRWLVILHTVLYYVCMAGTTSNMMNMTYSYVEERYFVQAISIKNSISGVCGFLASLVGSRILKAVQANGNSVCGVPVYGQQVLALLSVAILLLAFLLTHFVIRKQTRMAQ